MKIITIFLMILLIVSVNSSAQMGSGMMHDTSPIRYKQSQFTEQMHISRGGQLYDNWWRATINTNKPEKDHPLWKKQDTNKQSGYSTYRCKECHGWDYRGKDGAYGKGSHYTGFKGVYEAAQKMSVKELEAELKGSTDKEHDFSEYLDDNNISDLALFMKKGLIDTNKFVSKDGTPLSDNPGRGNDIFMRNCTHMCHGRTGAMINFGDSEKPEFVGTVANKNPWEFIHKVRAGQPGTRMRSAIINNWKEQNILDLLVFARTLPKDAPKVGWFSRMMGRMGFSMGHHKWRSSDETRGFGPIME